jgi:hypothetical protein
MKCLRLVGAWFTAAGILLSLLVWPYEGTAGPMTKNLDPLVSGDPDEPGGRHEPIGAAYAASLPLVRILIQLPTGNTLIIEIIGANQLSLQRHSQNELRARTVVRAR